MTVLVFLSILLLELSLSIQDGEPRFGAKLIQGAKSTLGANLMEPIVDSGSTMLITHTLASIWDQ